MTRLIDIKAQYYCLNLGDIAAQNDSRIQTRSHRYYLKLANKGYVDVTYSKRNVCHINHNRYRRCLQICDSKVMQLCK